jgi:hypothetical protein
LGAAMYEQLVHQPESGVIGNLFENNRFIRLGHECANMPQIHRLLDHQVVRTMAGEKLVQ